MPPEMQRSVGLPLAGLHAQGCVPMCARPATDRWLPCPAGRGTCLDTFCHCKPPFFSTGCSRSRVYPANHSRPSPVAFKIYK